LQQEFDVNRCAAVVLATALAACASSHGTAIDLGDKPPGVGGTISGIVRDSGGAALSGRKVTAVNTDTGARVETTTATNGGYTMKVARGKYHLEVELRSGESLSERPGDVEISASDLDASRNFVITVRSDSDGSPRAAPAPRPMLAG
jgi:Carboxypeptidase regulatory-like domain